MHVSCDCSCPGDCDYGGSAWVKLLGQGQCRDGVIKMIVGTPVHVMGGMGTYVFMKAGKNIKIDSLTMTHTMHNTPAITGKFGKENLLPSQPTLLGNKVPVMHLT